MAGSTSVILVRVLGNTKGLTRSLQKAQNSLGGLERISRGITGSMGVAAKATVIFGAAAVAAGIAGSASLAGIPVIIGAIALAATALGAGALAGVAAGFFGIGIAAAAQSERVKSAFGDMATFVKDRMQELAQPLVGPLVRGAGQLRQAFEALAPAFGNIFRQAAPLLDRFFARLEPLAQRIAPAMVRAFEAGTPVLAAFIRGMEPLTTGVIRFFDAIGAQSGTFAKFARSLMSGLGQVIGSLGRFLAALAPIGVTVVQTILPALASMFRSLSRSMGPAFEAGIPILRAFGAGIKELGGGLAGFMTELRESQPAFIEFTRTLFAGLAELLPALGRLIAALAPVGTAILQTVLPALTSLANYLANNVGPAFTAVTGFFREHETVAKAVGIALVSLVAITKAVQIAMSLAAAATLVFQAVAVTVRAAIIVWKNAQLALNLAMMLNPIGLVIAAIVALVAIFVLAYKKSETFRAVVDKAWAGIKSATTSVWNYLQSLTLKVWTGIKDAATSAVNGVKSGVTSAWNAIKSATTSVWNGIKSVVGSVTAFIVGLFMNFSVPGLIIKHWSTIRAATTSAWNGIKSAVSTAVSSVVQTVASIKSKVTGAFAGAAGWLLSAGRSIIQGLLDGIGGMIGSVQSKLGELTSMIPKWKGPAAKDRKLLRPVGKMIMKGLIKGFEDGRDGIRNVLEKVTDLITRTMDTRFKSDKLAKAASKEAIAALADESKALLANARVRETVATKLDAARDRLKDALQQSRDYAAAVKESVIAFGAITGFQDADTGLVTAKGIVEGLREKVASAQQYAKLLRRLTKMGINKTTLDQLAQAGVEGGLATAQALAKGGKEAVTEVNKLTKDLTATGVDMGKKLSKTLYGTGIEAAQGLVAGLKSQQQALREVARQMGQDLAAELRAQLDIPDPKRRPKLSEAASTGKRGKGDDDLASEMRKTRKSIERLPSKYRLNERAS